MCHLERLVEESLHSFRQTPDEPKWVSQNIQSKHQDVHLLQELQHNVKLIPV